MRLLKTVILKFKNPDFLEKGSFVVFFMLCIFLTFNVHNRNPLFTYKSEVWADKAGYYIFLPASLIYHFNPDFFPDDIDAKTGDGFSLRKIKGKVYTKYTYGVALMQTPFFLSAHLLTLATGGKADGFSEPYQRAMNIGAVFWLVMGLWFLKRFLERYFKKTVVYITLFFVFFGTNLYNYAIDETLMSHVYSFALVSIFLYIIQILIEKRFDNNYSVAFAGLIFGIIVLIRPTNIIFGLLILFLNVRYLSEFYIRLKQVVSIKRVLLFLIPFFLVLLPQFIYWHYLSGHFLFYSYNDEGFINWNSPKLAEIWFAPMNGLFLYSPVYLIIIAGIIYMIVKRKINGWLILMAFLVSSYIFASWHQWDFGCSYGQRSFIDFLPVFAIGLAFLQEAIFRNKNLILKVAFFVIAGYLTIFNLKMTYTFDECFYGEYWDWKEYGNLLDRSGFVLYKTHSYHFKNDFENPKKSKFVLYPENRDSVYFAKSGHFVSVAGRNELPASGFRGTLQRIGHGRIQSANIHASVFLTDRKSNGVLICAIDSLDVRIFSKEMAFDGLILPPGKWHDLKLNVMLPELKNKELVLKAFVLCRDTTKIFIDDFNIRFKY